MRASIGALFPSAACMKAESVYVIEDTHTMMMCSKEESDEGPIFCKQPAGILDIFSEAFYRFVCALALPRCPPRMAHGRPLRSFTRRCLLLDSPFSVAVRHRLLSMHYYWTLNYTSLDKTVAEKARADQAMWEESMSLVFRDMVKAVHLFDSIGVVIRGPRPKLERIRRGTDIVPFCTTELCGKDFCACLRGDGEIRVNKTQCC